MKGRREDSLDILFEDDYLVVVNKPGGLLTVSTGPGSGEQTLYRMVMEHCRNTHSNRSGGASRHSERNEVSSRHSERNEVSSRHSERNEVERRIPHEPRIFIVHRLDRDTSGIIVFAKSEDVKFALQENWDEAVIERKYVAIVEGIPPQVEGTISSYLRDNPYTKVVTSSPYDNGGKFAVTHYKVLRSSQKYSMVEFNLETGRKNQIRVHAALIGCPVAGDKKYGARTNPASRLCLHAQTLTFIHPVTRKKISFSSRLPGCFKKVL